MLYAAKCKIHKTSSDVQTTNKNIRPGIFSKKKKGNEKDLCLIS